MGKKGPRHFIKLHSRPTALRDPEVKAALIDLLDRENQASDLKNRAVHEAHESGVDTEGDDEYMAAVVSSVESFVDWNDARQGCVLVVSGHLTTDKIVEHARVAVPCFLERSKSSWGWERGPAIAEIVELLANNKTNLDPGTIQA